jgi:hypothetical protein
VTELADREGAPGALVELDDGRSVWMPMDALVLLRRSG